MDNDLRGIFSQLGDLKQNIANLKIILGQKTVKVTMNEGAIVVVANGLQQVEKLQLQQDRLPWNDQEKVAELVTRTVNEALLEAQEMAKAEIKKITGGLNIPGLSGLF